MDKTLFIHVGFPKTGTTSIQKHFDEHHIVDGIEYIKASEDRHREFWASLLFELGNKKGKVLQYGFTSGHCYKLVERYIEQIQQSNCDKFLISFEGLAYLAKVDDKKIFKGCIAKLKNAGVKVVVVIYLRSIRSYWESKYLSDAKTKDVGIFSSWLIRQLKTEASNQEAIDYFSELSDNNLVVEFFDGEIVKREGVVKHFIKALQHPWDRNKVKGVGIETHNATKDDQSLAKIRLKRGLPDLQCLNVANDESVVNLLNKNKKLLKCINTKNNKIFHDYLGVSADNIDSEWVISVERKHNVKRTPELKLAFIQNDL